MTIAQGYRSNLNTIALAANHNDLCLMECTDKATGKTVIALCAAYVENGDTVVVPLAKMFDGNPYDELDPSSVGETK